MYVTSLGLATFFAESGMWLFFFITVCICSVLFVTLKLISHNKIQNLIEKQESKKYRLLNLMSNCGIHDIYDMSNNESQDLRNLKTREVIESGNSFSLLTMTGQSYLDPTLKRHYDCLKNALERGAYFRVILIDPFCDEKLRRDKINGITPGADRKNQIENAILMAKKYDNIEIRVCNTAVYCAIFLSDDFCIYDPYHLGKESERSENYFLALNIEKNRQNGGQSPYYKIMRSHFESVWRTSIDIREYQKSVKGSELCLE